jgi:hypothetical protein
MPSALFFQPAKAPRQGRCHGRRSPRTHQGDLLPHRSFPTPSHSALSLSPSDPTCMQGHLGVTAVDASRGDIDKLLGALKASLEEAGFKKGSVSN